MLKKYQRLAITRAPTAQLNAAMLLRKTPQQLAWT